MLPCRTCWNISASWLLKYCWYCYYVVERGERGQLPCSVIAGSGLIQVIMSSIWNRKWWVTGKNIWIISTIVKLGKPKLINIVIFLSQSKSKSNPKSESKVQFQRTWTRSYSILCQQPIYHQLHQLFSATRHQTKTRWFQDKIKFYSRLWQSRVQL